MRGEDKREQMNKGNYESKDERRGNKGVEMRKVKERKGETPGEEMK